MAGSFSQLFFVLLAINVKKSFRINAFCHSLIFSKAHCQVVHANAVCGSSSYRL